MVDTHKLWKTSNRSAEAAVNAAEHAKASAEVAALAFQSNRAWLSFKSVLAVYNYDHETISFSVTWVNSGRSPAIDVRPHTTTLPLQQGQVAEPFEKPDFDTIAPVAPLGPDLTRDVGGLQYGRDFVSEWAAGRMRLIAYSHVQYGDLPTNTVRYSKYCGEVAFVWQVLGSDGNITEFHVSSRTYGPQNTVS